MIQYKQKQREEGITLIALIVTIIVLIILAAVTIIALTGENNILGNAQLAKVSNAYRGIEDQIKLSYMSIVSHIQVQTAFNASYSANTETNAEEILKILQNNLKGNNSTKYEFGKKTQEVAGEDGITKIVVNEIWIKSKEGQIEAERIEEGVPRYDGIIYTQIILNGQNVEYKFDVEKPTDVTFVTASGTPVAPEPDVPVDTEKPEGPVMPETWDSGAVYAYESLDGKIVPVPIGFTVSDVETEKSVDTGLVIKITQEGIISEFVWVPVTNTSDMFGVDKDGNFLGKLYTFGDSGASPLNWTEAEDINGNKVMNWTSKTGYREPDYLTDTTYGDASTTTGRGIDQLKNVVGLTGSNSEILTKWKEQLQEEFETMKESVEKYNGFYIGRYETGNLSQNKVVVAKNNSDIGGQNWYTMYQRSKTIAEGTSATSSMIWGCQWDATLRWFLSSEDEETRNYVIDSAGKGNYVGTQGDTNRVIPTGSNNDYRVNNIYDMAGNEYEWILEATTTGSRLQRRWQLQLYTIQPPSFGLHTCSTIRERKILWFSSHFNNVALVDETVRDRDTMEQVRVKIDDLTKWIEEKN